MIFLTIKQLKRRVVQGLVEPELAYMPWGKKEELKELTISSYCYKVHQTLYESLYHGWEKYPVVSIENIKIENDNIFLSNQKIGTFYSSSTSSSSSILLHIELHQEIKCYGTLFRGICKKRTITSMTCRKHISDLFTCVKTARPKCTFYIDGYSHDFFLFSIYFQDVILDFIDGYKYGYFEWKIYYDLIDNSIKSFLILRDENDYNTIIKKSEIITVYENFIKGR